MAQQTIDKKPLPFQISAIIPVYNGAKFIIEAIKSIEAQTNSVYEIICVDDASTDDTSQIVNEVFPQVKLIRLKHNSGPSYARNIGIKAAKGNIIAFLDADDIWPKDKIEYFSNKLKSEREAKITGGIVLSFRDHEGPDLDKEPYFNFYMSSFLIYKSVFEEIGYFDESMRLSEDQDWFLRVREAQTNILVFKKVGLFVREHENNTTKNMDTKQIGLTEALRKSMIRRRGIGFSQNLSKINILNE